MELVTVNVGWQIIVTKMLTFSLPVDDLGLNSSSIWICDRGGYWSLRGYGAGRAPESSGTGRDWSY